MVATGFDIFSSANNPLVAHMFVSFFLSLGLLPKKGGGNKTCYSLQTKVARDYDKLVCMVGVSLGERLIQLP